MPDPTPPPNGLESLARRLKGMDRDRRDLATPSGTQRVGAVDQIEVHDRFIAPPVPPGTPSVPVLSSSSGRVTVTWDGLLGGVPPVVGFREVFAEVAVAEPNVDTVWARAGQAMTGGDSEAILTAPAGMVVWVRLRAINNSELVSEPSGYASVVVAGVSTADLGDDVSGSIADATSTADQAAADALAAAQTAQDALTAVDKAIVSSIDEYVVSGSSSVPPPPDAAWDPDTPDWEPGQFVWRRTRNTHVDETVTYSAPSVITGADGVAGEDAVLLRVASSRGTSFKNNAISTVLTVTVFKGSRQIVNLTDLQAEFGNTVFLEWWWRRLDDTDFGVISSADARLSQGGFALTVSPADVDEQTVFQCILHT